MSQCIQKSVYETGIKTVEIVDEIKYSFFDKIYYFFKGNYFNYIDQSFLGKKVKVTYIFIISYTAGIQMEFYFKGKPLNKKVIKKIISHTE